MSAGTNASIQAEATSGRISAVPHTSVCGQKSQPGRRKPGGQPGNSNALKLKRTQSASA